MYSKPILHIGKSLIKFYVVIVNFTGSYFGDSKKRLTKTWLSLSVKVFLQHYRSQKRFIIECEVWDAALDSTLDLVDGIQRCNYRFWSSNILSKKLRISSRAHQLLVAQVASHPLTVEIINRRTCLAHQCFFVRILVHWNFLPSLCFRFI